MEIRKLIESLQKYEASGIHEVQVSDGYHGHEFQFQIRAEAFMNAQRHLSLMPVNNGDGRRTSGILETNEAMKKPHWSKEVSA